MQCKDILVGQSSIVHLLSSHPNTFSSIGGGLAAQVQQNQ